MGWGHSANECNRHKLPFSAEEPTHYEGLSTEYFLVIGLILGVVLGSLASYERKCIKSVPGSCLSNWLFMGEMGELRDY